MNDEIKLLDSRIKPVIDELAEGSFELGPQPSEFLSQFYEQDETAKFLFDSFVAKTEGWKNTGVFTITNTHELEKVYADPPLRGKELIENRIFIFAIDGDGSFFGFGLDSREFYHFDHGPWFGEEEPWDNTLSNRWDTAGFCGFFEEEYAVNDG